MYVYLSHYFWLGMIARIFVSVNIPIVWMGLIIFILHEICMFASYYLVMYIVSLCTCCGKQVEKDVNNQVKEQLAEEAAVVDKADKRQDQEIQQLDK